MLRIIMKINIEDIKKHIEFRKKINCNIELDEIEFYEKGKKIEISKKVIKEWNYTGLNNIDFISTLAYKQNPSEKSTPTNDILEFDKLKLGSDCDK